MARNNYNRYAQQYSPQQQDANLIYQPTFDANSVSNQMLVENFDRSQQRYDAGKQQFAKFKGTQGGMDTYSPDLLKNRLGEFSDEVSGTVQDQYGGDWGLAANDIVEMIADERANPLYKAIDYQNKEVERQKQFVAQKRGLGEGYVIQNNAMDITGDDFKELVDSGNYAEGLTFSGTNLPNFDKVATDLVKNIRPDSLTGLTGLEPKEEALLAQAIGSGNLNGFLANMKESGTSKKLNTKAIQDSLVESFVNQAGEPLAAKVQNENPDFTPEEVQAEVENQANNYIENKIPQLSSYAKSRTVTNLGGKSSDSNEPTRTSFTNVPGYSNVSSSKYTESTKKYGTGEGQTDLSKYQIMSDEDMWALDAAIETNNKKLKEYRRAGSSDSPQAKAEATAIALENKEYETQKAASKTMNNIYSFSNRYGINEGDFADRNEFVHAISNLQDKTQNKEGKFISLGNTTLNTAAKTAFVNGSSRSKIYVHDGFENGEPHFTPYNQNEAVIPGRNNDLSNSKDREEMLFVGVNPATGRYVFETDDKGAHKVEIAPSSNAQSIGAANKRVYSALEEHDYSTERNSSNQNPELTLRYYSNGELIDGVVSVPKELISEFNRLNSLKKPDLVGAQKLFEKITENQDPISLDTKISYEIAGMIDELGMGNKAINK